MQEQRKNKIHYTIESRRDLDGIWDYIVSELQNPSAAENVVGRIMDDIDQLENYAHLGTPLSAIADIDGDYRFLVSGNYMVFYRANGNDITPFKNPTTRKYGDGTRFEDIVALYDFDEDLRELFLKYILKIERHIRALLSYHFTEKHGEQQCEYLNSANYAMSRRNANGINRLVATLGNLANHNSDYPYINHQRQVYGNVPLWVLFNGVTFGSLSKFYSYTTQGIQTKVAKNFDKVNRKQLEQYLSVITKFRNVCAHGERLFSYQTHNDIPDTDLHRKLRISRNGTQYAVGKRDLFAVVIAFRYLLPNEDFKQFKTGLNRAIRNYLKSSGTMTESKLYQYMGFPNNWSKITAYQK